MLSMLGKKSNRQIFKYFFIFFPEISFDISCKLSPWETICMKYQSLLSVKNIVTLSFAEFKPKSVKIYMPESVGKKMK